MKHLLLIVFALSIFANERQSSYPYLSGDTWRYSADWRLSKNPKETFNPKEVKLGDTIFVEYDCLRRFAHKYLPKIKNRFILITPNCEAGTDNPQPGKFEKMLDSEKISAWFVQNIDRAPSKRLIPLPIGLANQVWDHGQVAVLDPKVQAAPPRGESRDQLLYMNFALHTNRQKREPCYKYFETFSSVTIATNRNFGEYLEDLSHTVFVVSPPGNGEDCHRTWEALLMGCYPIVLSSTLNPLYEDLPVVVVSHWDEITEEFLEKKKEEFASKFWNLEKLYAPYWFKHVSSLQMEIRENPTFMEKVHAWFSLD